MDDRTKQTLWGLAAATVVIWLFERWHSKKSNISGSYASAEDVEPMAIHGPTKDYPKSTKEEPRPRGKRAKLACKPVETTQESQSNTQILACRGEPLGRVQSAKDAYELVRGQSQLLQEELIVLAMNSRNNVVATSVVHRGTSNGVSVGSADVFRTPVIYGASRMILVHNHPSGDPTPSPSDVALTRKFRGLGDEMGIALLDHVIVGENNFSSLRDLGILN